MTSAWRFEQLIAKGGQREVFALALHICFADGHDIVIIQFWQIATGEVEHFMFEKEHRVVVANGRFEQTFGIVGGGGRDDFDAGELGVGAVDRLAVLRAVAFAAPLLTADHHRHTQQTASHVVHLGSLIEDLVGTAVAAPIAMPINPCSLIGVSSMRVSPNSLNRLRVTRKSPP